jgi:hypothetical protein
MSGSIDSNLGKNNGKSQATGVVDCSSMHSSNN